MPQRNLAPFLAAGGHNGRREAVRHILATAQRAMTVEEIRQELRRQGFPTASHDRVRDTLRLSPDIIRMGHGLWMYNQEYPWPQPWRQPIDGESTP